ncbi:unnamed protein product [Cyprideis torosa]|uniref:Uncharacterized protein n=1 Tax=Cyprideis torosa TaxID=163714 RepID=A0A7R8W135_9CRUS|nr:unnamed protein product [Cyprideis torosa]CAG0880283.1 unnamed protein product [Cyprideis torosa]
MPQQQKTNAMVTQPLKEVEPFDCFSLSSALILLVTMISAYPPIPQRRASSFSRWQSQPQRASRSVLQHRHSPYRHPTSAPLNLS